MLHMQHSCRETILGSNLEKTGEVNFGSKFPRARGIITKYCKPFQGWKTPDPFNGSSPLERLRANLGIFTTAMSQFWLA